MLIIESLSVQSIPRFKEESMKKTKMAAKIGVGFGVVIAFKTSSECTKIGTSFSELSKVQLGNLDLMQVNYSVPINADYIL